MSKWISVIIPHYNSIELLEKLINSIPEEPSIEIIVVDDKSTKDIDRIHALEERMNSKGQVFLHNVTEKKGAGTCRNIALEVATGEWVLFADADDYFLDNAFDNIRKACELNKDLVYFPPTSIYLEDGKVADRHVDYEKWVTNYKENPSLENELLLRYKFLIPSNKLIKRCAIGEVRFDEVMASNDVMFSTKMAYKVRNIGVYTQPIYCLTKSANTLTTKKSKENLEIRVKVFVDRYIYLREKLKREDFEMLGLTGKWLMGKAFLDGYGIGEVLWIYREYRKNKIKVFSIKSLIKDVKDLIKVLLVKVKDNKRNI